MNAEVALLRQILVERRPALLGVAETIGSHPLPRGVREDLRGVVCDELCEKGLDDGGTPNGYGLRLENLIDALGRW
jgi:hypothetical protein